MTAKVFFVFLVVTSASLVFFSLEVVATKDEGSDLESHGRALVGGLLSLVPRIYRIYKILNTGEKVYQAVNWTRTQAYDYIDQQCFAYCHTTATTPSSCECDVSRPNEQPIPTPFNMTCTNFQRYCCDFSIIKALECQQCCKGLRPLSPP